MFFLIFSELSFRLDEHIKYFQGFTSSMEVSLYYLVRGVKYSLYIYHHWLITYPLKNFYHLYDLQGGLYQLCSTAVIPRLKPLIDGFNSTSHNISEVITLPRIQLKINSPVSYIFLLFLNLCRF